jgi:hypothetical protein
MIPACEEGHPITVYESVLGKECGIRRGESPPVIGLVKRPGYH